jgi:hypothetical protein
MFGHEIIDLAKNQGDWKIKKKPKPIGSLIFQNFQSFPNLLH